MAAVRAPRVSIGLPVHNGEPYLAAAIEALLGQTYLDLELVISDNASDDGTAALCRRYAEQDPRVRYIRQLVNIGISPNHEAVFRQARGEFFKWAGHDDLYARTFVERCVRALDADPGLVLATAQTAKIDGEGAVTSAAVPSPRDSDSPDAARRLRGLLRATTGDDDYGLIRTAVLGRTNFAGSFYHADRSFVAELALHGRFHREPEPLYFRRDLPDRAGRQGQSIRAWCEKHDPRRADRLRHPTARLRGEYVWAFPTAIRRAPLSAADKLRCGRELVAYAADRLWWTARRRPDRATDEAPVTEIDVAALVAGTKGDGGGVSTAV